MGRESYQNRKGKRELKYKEERTIFEQAMKAWIKEAKTTNFVLIVIAMFLVGIFLRLIFWFTTTTP